MVSEFEIRPLEDADRDWVRRLLKEHWGSVELISRGKLHKADELPGFVAIYSGEPSGLATYLIDGDECEIVSLNSLVEGKSIGTALLDAVRNTASSTGCKRLWLVTTNDNLHAMGFYQKRGFVLVAVHCNSIEQYRKMKPTIPHMGKNGIPLRDEIEMEIEL